MSLLKMLPAVMLLFKRFLKSLQDTKKESMLPSSPDGKKPLADF